MIVVVVVIVIVVVVEVVLVVVIKSSTTPPATQLATGTAILKNRKYMGKRDFGGLKKLFFRFQTG